ncbi:MAG: hypothetical protein D8M26_13520 [Ignavibacteriae bacterium]|nr:hypothetical protein [Ignavibacteriota bacterium]MCE7855094.1 hypothetical protein [Ignavibacteria bacterium CHB3]GJQ42664.1 MAG: hypothetical protein JETCAE03_21620 [Ignavibacteriaceae bacterium]
MGSLSAKRIVDPVLTNLARGYHNSMMIASALFPIVTVQKEAGKIPLFTKESFKIYNTERAIRAKSNRISPEDRSSIDFVLTEHDLEYPIDYREEQEDSLPSKMNATKVCVDGIALRLEKIAADMAQDLANFPAGNKVTLAAGDKFTNTSSDPFPIFSDAVEAVRASIGVRPNVCVMGASSYAALKEHPGVIDRIKYSQKGVITPELLKQLLDFEQLYIGDAVYASDANDFSDVWSDNVIIAYVPKAQSNIPRSYFEPAFGYTLKKINMPVVDTYTEGGKVMMIRNTDIFVSKIVGSDAGYLINDTNA